MQNEDWKKTKEIFHQTLELPKNEQQLFLAKQADFVRNEVVRLLNTHEKLNNFIAEPIAIEIGFDTNSYIGKKIGQYKIISLLGSGGMGQVFLAEKNGLDKKFALKIIKRGMDTDALLNNFLRERQILSRLENSFIAGLIDAGSTDNDLPFFVMEYVDGLPITKFCDSHQLNTNERLEIFQKVCSAVNYAHQNLIIHSDIKPSNILVSAEGTPKLLDFGIAKLINSDDIENTATAIQARMLTPEYASPEQLTGLRVSTATDVYSLGVVLYELLSGVRPFKSEKKSFQEVANLVLTQEPISPSSVVSGQWSVVRHTSKNKGQISHPQTAIRNLKGDLDNIILKSIRKEPERRYQSVQEFSEDIRKFLIGLPVTATADTKFYRLTKYIKRNKIGSAVALLIILLSAVSVWQGITANRERARAEKRFNQVRKLANSLLFEYNDSMEHLPGSTAVRQKMISDSVEYLDILSDESRDDTELEMELAIAYKKVGDIQGNPYLPNLGDTTAAKKNYQKALLINERLAAANPVDKNARRNLANNYGAIADISWTNGDIENALAYYRMALAIDEKLATETKTEFADRYALAHRYYSIGQTLRKAGDSAGAIENFQKSLEINRQLFSIDESNINYRQSLATSLLKIGDVYFEQKNYAAALENHQTATETLGLVGNEPNNAANQRMYALFLNRLALDKKALGDIKTAVIHDLKALEIQKNLAELDRENNQYQLDLGATYRSLGDSFVRLNKTVEAIKYLNNSIVIFEDSLAKNPNRAESKEMLSNAYQTLGDALSQKKEANEAKTAFEKANSLTK